MARRRTIDKPEIATRGPARKTAARIPTLDSLDGRTLAAKRYRELKADYVADLGGEDMITTGELALIDRSVSLQIFAEAEETKLLQTGKCDMSSLTAVGNALRRHLSDLGLKRRAKNISPAEKIRRTLEGPVIDHDE